MLRHIYFFVSKLNQAHSNDLTNIAVNTEEEAVEEEVEVVEAEEEATEILTVKTDEDLQKAKAVTLKAKEVIKADYVCTTQLTRWPALSRTIKVAASTLTYST